jgi:hypothetical protein
MYRVFQPGGSPVLHHIYVKFHLAIASDINYQYTAKIGSRECFRKGI